MCRGVICAQDRSIDEVRFYRSETCSETKEISGYLRLIRRSCGRPWKPTTDPNSHACLMCTGDSCANGCCRLNVTTSSSSNASDGSGWLGGLGHGAFVPWQQPHGSTNRHVWRGSVGGPPEGFASPPSVCRTACRSAAGVGKLEACRGNHLQPIVAGVVLAARSSCDRRRDPAHPG